MQDKYLIVNKKILPDFYDKVIEARSLLETGRAKNVSEAVKQVGISRSTYYKFKDYIYLPTENSIGKKAIVSCMLMHKRGILSDLLNTLSIYHANILTINQSIPINGQAAVTISLDITDLSITIDDLIEKIRIVKGVTSARLVAFD